MDHQTFPRAPWDSCEIRYRVWSLDAAQDLTLHPAMPCGWTLLHAEPLPDRRAAIVGGVNVAGGYCLVFKVQGEVSDRDGVIVRSIIERLGML